MDYFPVLQTSPTNLLDNKFGFESFSTFVDVIFLGRKTHQKTPVIKAGKIKKIDFCSATRFSLVQGVKHPLSNNVFIGLECKMKSFNLLSNKVWVGSMVQGIQLNLTNKVLIGLRPRFAHAAQNRIFILLCSFFPRA